MTFLSPSHPCFASNSEPNAEPSALRERLGVEVSSLAWRVIGLRPENTEDIATAREIVSEAIDAILAMISASEVKS